VRARTGGEEPPERPDELLAELDGLCIELQLLLATINHTNAKAKLATGETVTEVLARRDVIAYARAHCAPRSRPQPATRRAASG
jgi:hypothetical protein